MGENLQMKITEKKVVWIRGMKIKCSVCKRKVAVVCQEEIDHDRCQCHQCWTVTRITDGAYLENPLLGLPDCRVPGIRLRQKIEMVKKIIARLDKIA